MTSAALEETAARLALGGQGRTEADVQSDVRKFLLDAKLQLGGEQLVDVALEAQAGGGRRIDVEAGNAAIEVKKSLASPTVLAAARQQVAGYVEQRSEELDIRYVGILTDGRSGCCTTSPRPAASSRSPSSSSPGPRAPTSSPPGWKACWLLPRRSSRRRAR